ELLSGLISLGLLLPYYYIIWLNRAGLKKNFSFTIKPNK
ncbi:MAG: RseC/MucC family positive regulator of sigma(E), partial [Mediterranea sp.]|nr:RseC/MucC family positive regulator of sigma(E) [Mediterranea sp.]